MQNTVEDIIVEIARDKSDGATALAARGLDALEEFALSLTGEPNEALVEATLLAARIDRLRPSMGAIGSQAVLAIARCAALISEGVAPSVALKKAVNKERETLGQANLTISSLALKEFGEGGVFVSCSWSMTVMRALVALKPDKIYFGEGHRIQDGLKASGWLSARGCNVEVVPDGALPTIVEGAKAVVVGADQILTDGSVINRCSTFSLGLAAKHFGVPFWVLCQRIKLCGLDDVKIEDAYGLLEDPPEGVIASAPLFDKTPSSLVTGVITETGNLTASEAGEVGAAIDALRGRFFR